MAWAISVTRNAADAIRRMDPSLREELIRRVAEMAEAPLEHVTRGGPADAAYVFAYRSEVVVGMTVTLLLTGLDQAPPRLVLVAVRDEMED